MRDPRLSVDREAELQIMPLRIEDYALIGDCETAALVGRDGSIDWLCVPRFDSPACFAALLGTPEHGRWLISPATSVLAIRRRYRPGTLVLETEFDTDAGVVVLVDCMPVRAHTPHLIRMLEGKRGDVPMRLELVIRLDRVKGMGIEEVLTAPQSPWQNPFAERLIGSIRRECLNHVLVLDERHLRRTLARYVSYYHQARTHLALDKDAPDIRPIALPAAGKIVQLPDVGGLHHRYVRQAA